MHNGYLKLYRKISNNPLWTKKPFSDGQAWVDLLLIANHKDGVIDKRGNRVKVERGQVGYSVLGLSDRWGWSRGKVDRFLKYLENEHQIEQQKNNVTTLITILNYEEYNGTDTKPDSKRAADGQQTDINKNEKKGKNVNKTSLPENFEASEPVKIWASKKGYTITPDDLEAFCLHHDKLGSKFVKWDAAFQTWMNNKAKFNKSGDDNNRPILPRYQP